MTLESDARGDRVIEADRLLADVEALPPLVKRLGAEADAALRPSELRASFRRS